MCQFYSRIHCKPTLSVGGGRQAFETRVFQTCRFLENTIHLGGTNIMKGMFGRSKAGVENANLMNLNFNI